MRRFWSKYITPSSWPMGPFPCSYCVPFVHLILLMIIMPLIWLIKEAHSKKTYDTFWSCKNVSLSSVYIDPWLVCPLLHSIHSWAYPWSTCSGCGPQLTHFTCLAHRNKTYKSLDMHIWYASSSFIFVFIASPCLAYLLILVIFPSL